MTDVLQRICAVKREHVARRKAEWPLARLLADLAVSDVDGVIHRVGYEVTLLGRITEVKAS